MQQFSDRKYVRPLTSSAKKALHSITHDFISPRKIEFISPKKQLSDKKDQQDDDTKQIIYEGLKQMNQKLKELITYKYTMLEYYQNQDQQLLSKLNELANQQQIVSQDYHKYMAEAQQGFDKFDQHIDKVLQQNIQQLQLDEVTLQQRLDQRLDIQKTIKWHEEVILQRNRIQEQICAKEQNIKLIQNKRAIVLKDTQNLSLKMKEKSDKVLDLQNDTKQLINQQRVLNNELQEAKGNIRVYCRVRPLISGEDETQVPCVTANGDCSILLTVDYLIIILRSRKIITNQTTFQRVIASTSNISLRWQQKLSQLIENVIDGHNVCIFAYGQTGSGKTFTMQGLETYDKRGVIPRAVEHIFNEIKNLRDLGWVFKIRIGFQEIYNESIRDLLSNQKTGNPLFVIIILRGYLTDRSKRSNDGL